MPAKKHHYVPVFYQKGFSDSTNLLWVYDRKLRLYKHLHPKVLCREEDLYAVRTKGGSKDRRIETDLLSPIDGQAALVIRKLAPGVKPSRQEFRRLVRFISLQHTRLPSFGRAVSRVHEATANDWLRLRFGTEARAKAAFAEMERETGTKSIEDPASIVASVLSRKFSARATERVFLESMFEIANTLGKWLEESQWTILTAYRGSGFVVCDHPFVAVPPKGAALDGMGFGVSGTTCYFPLTKRLCLMTRHGDYGFGYKAITTEAVRTVNYNVAASSERFIMASDLGQLTAVVRKSGCEQPEATQRYSINVIEEDESNSLLRFTQLPGRYFY